jgi:phage FluMu protein Com
MENERLEKRQEIRCRSCRILLATTDKHGIELRRGGLQARFAFGTRAVIVCYRPRCRELNMIDLGRSGTP